MHLSQRSLALIFYVAVPVFFGFVLGRSGAGLIAGYLDRPLAIGYWIGAAFLMRLTIDAMTRLVAYGAPKGRTPLVALCVLGGVIHPFIGLPVLHLWQDVFIPFVPADVDYAPISSHVSSLPQYLEILRLNTFIIVEWTLMNLFFDRVLGYRRFRDVTGYRPRAEREAARSGAAADAVLTDNSNLAARLPEELGREVWSISAEDHYVRVRTERGNHMTLYRFGDALRELPESAGFRVHRSHWVSRAALTRVIKEGGKTFVELPNEDRLPVSSRYLEVLRVHGFTIT